MSRFLTAALAAIMFVCAEGSSWASDRRRPGDFDYFVLALSWSPSFCAEEGAEDNRQQCGTDRNFGFVVHGLWPQYERGYPRDCRVGQRHVPDSLVRSLSDIMPSTRLVGHQWRIHGTCSGLDQWDYFRTLRAARQKIRIPDYFKNPESSGLIAASEVEKAFLSVNREMDEDGISVTCERRFLREVRICMTKDLKFRPCEQLESKSCRSDRLIMPPRRGSGN